MAGLIDCDIHYNCRSLADIVPYLDPAYRDLVAHSGTAGLELPNYLWQHPTGWLRRDTYTPDEPPAVTVDQIRREVLDPYGVSYGILIPTFVMGISIMPNLHLAAALAAAHNDWMCDYWLSSDPRLRGSLVVAAQNPLAAAREIRRLGAREDVVQVILPGGARIPYGNPFYDPIWEAAHEVGLVVAIHTFYEGQGIAGPVTAAGQMDFYIEHHTLCGVSLMGHLVSILCHGILERFPGQKVLIVEGGVAWVPAIMWRLDTNWRSCRSEIPFCKRQPSEYVWESVRFTTQPLEAPDDPDLLAPALAGMHPAETLCYASDYPHWDFDEPTLTLRTLPREWRERIAFDNARQLYGLPVPAGPVVAVPSVASVGS